MDHLPEVELQKEIEDLFYDRKLTKDEAIQALQALQQKNPDQFDPRKYLIDSQNAMKDIVIKRLKEFKSAGEASKIKPIPLSVMSKKYSSGELY